MLKKTEIISLILCFLSFCSIQAKITTAQTFQWPVDSPKITQEYAAYNDGSANKYHTGLDIVSSKGSTEVFAVDSGTVNRIENNTFNNDNHGMGNVVIITHNNGQGPFSLYAHLDSISVSDGQYVTKGTQLGVMGKTGNTNAVHLHFELKERGTLGNLDDDLGPNWGYTSEKPNLYGYINPYPYLEYTIKGINPTSIKATSDNQPVRTGPDTSYSKYFATVSSGQKYAAFSEYNGWYQIYVPSNYGPATGWMQGTTDSSSSIVEVNCQDCLTNGVNVRDSATTSANKITYVWDKQQFVTFDQKNGIGCSNFWYKIYLSNGFSSLNGWVCGDYLTNITTSTITHTLTPPSKTTVSQGGVLGPFTVEETNNSDSYYAFYLKPYVSAPDGTTVNLGQLSTSLKAGETRRFRGKLQITLFLELGTYTFTFGVKLTDTSGNLIDNDSFEFTVVSSTSYAMRRSARKLKRLMRNPEAQVMEEDGWKVVIVPEKDR